MRKESNNIQVKRPAVQELEESESCLKRSCGKGCFFIVLLIILSLTILKFATSPQMKEVKEVPDNFPDSIPVYAEDSIQKIAHSSKNNSTFLAKITDIVPKFFLVSYHIISGEDSPESLQNYLNTKEYIEEKPPISKFIYLMNQPTQKQQDKVIIEWKNITAEPAFVHEYYTKQLRNNNFEVNTTADTKTQKQLSFSKGKIIGRLYIEDNAETPGTTEASLDVVIPAK